MRLVEGNRIFGSDIEVFKQLDLSSKARKVLKSTMKTKKFKRVDKKVRDNSELFKSWSDSFTLSFKFYCVLGQAVLKNSSAEVREEFHEKANELGIRPE